MSYTASRLAEVLADSVSWLSVRTADAVPGPDWVSCADLIAEQQAGGDPTYSWRAAAAADYARDYSIEPPVQVAAMFTLMWYVQVPSLVAGVTSAVAGMSPDVSPAALAFKRHPVAHYPAAVALLSDEVVPVATAATQIKDHTKAFLDSYEPGVKLGSLQRFGAVDDEVRAAIRLPEDAPYADRAATAFGVSLEAKLRTSCCYFYVLPNVAACTTCPRFR
ncbi:FhuF-like iron-sulfur protein [Kribbella sp. VKM Ac-2571]|uniref:(2Fe-2S)-binding protein n=1 Tax=Kribbella sp. VKM Ac-2571 TaxID=2512222 RepID=UPI00105EFDE8|nr:(2Fe-2S)-binding protein [Kribbella sp. VKM Ac-2571]TDO63877.1 FhuF-like iron-sulfur protein [Kribbella sp. VKM Ac-2571]